MKTLLFAVFLNLTSILSAYAGATVDTSITLSSTTVGVQIVSSINGGVSISGASGGTAFCLAKFTADCATFTTGCPYYINPPTGWEFIPKADGYTGQICGRLATSGSVQLSVNPW